MSNRIVHILLVEDSKTHAAFIQEALGSMYPPVKLTVAASLAEARTYLAGASPDLAIIDLFLSDGMGTDLMLTGNGQPDFPILIMTGQGDEKAAVESIKSGAHDYLIKTSDTLKKLPRIVKRTLREWKFIVERKQAEEALRDSEERFRSFFDSAASGMAIIGLDGKALRVNPAFCHMSGYTEEESLQLNVFEVTHPEDQELTRQSYDEIKAGKRRVIEYEKRYLHKNNSIVWGHTTVAGVYDTKGSLLYYAANVQNITERKMAEEELEAFTYTVSHDLRTPLTVISGYADLLQELCHDRLDKDALDYLENIRATTEKMAVLIDDLLDLATAGKVKTENEDVVTNDIVEEIVGELSAQVKTIGATVKVGELPTVQSTRTFFTQIFYNLIGNALHYGCKDNGVVEVGGERIGEKVRLYVRDHGSGIPEKEREHIFEAFYRGKTVKNRSGSGVGLATVLKIVKRLDEGKVWVEETPGGGSTFMIEFTDKTTAFS